MVSLYSRPDHFLSKSSITTLLACRYLETTDLQVINFTKIHSVVGMPPLPLKQTDVGYNGYNYAARRPFSDMMKFIEEDADED